MSLTIDRMKSTSPTFAVVERQKTRMDQRQKRLAKMLNAAGRDDVRALRAVYSATSPQIFGLLLRLLDHRSLAEDALQQTFLVIWQQQRRYLPENGTPLTWLFAIAREQAACAMQNDRKAISGCIEDGAGAATPRPAARN